MKRHTLLLGIALALEGIAPAYAQQGAVTVRAGRETTCGQLAQRLRADFAAYRAVRSVAPRGSTAVAYLHVGITIQPRGARAARTRIASRPAELTAFRSKQMRTMARMRRAGCQF